MGRARYRLSYAAPPWGHFSTHLLARLPWNSHWDFHVPRGWLIHLFTLWLMCLNMTSVSNLWKILQIYWTDFPDFTCSNYWSLEINPNAVFPTESDLHVAVDVFFAEEVKVKPTALNSPPHLLHWFSLLVTTFASFTLRLLLLLLRKISTFLKGRFLRVWKNFILENLKTFR